MNKISPGFQAVMKASLPVPPEYHDYDLSMGCSPADVQELADAATTIIDYLNDFDLHAAPGCGLYKSETTYPRLIILTQENMAPSVKQVLVESKAVFPSFACLSSDLYMGTDCMLCLVKDPITGQEGVLFRVGPEEIKGFSQNLLTIRAGIHHAHVEGLHATL